MTTLNNIERLIQMATIEQMYSMMQKMKGESSENVELPKYSNDKFSELFTMVNSLEIKYECIDELCCKINALEASHVKLISNITTLEKELQEVTNYKQHPDNAVNHLVTGQQKITQYRGFTPTVVDRFSPTIGIFKPIIIEEEHIKLQIEEKLDTKNDGVVDLAKVVNTTSVDQISKDLRDCEIITNFNMQMLGDQEDIQPFNMAHYDTRLEEVVVEEVVVEEVVVEEVVVEEVVVE